jgi:hypothetical protein
MNKFLLEMAIANKIARMARQQDLTDEEVRQILQADPDLSAAIAEMDQTRPMAEASLAADNLSQLIRASDWTSKPTRAPQALQSLEAQTLQSWVGNLQRASQEN